MSEPMGEFIANVPAPSSHHRENKTPALLEQNWVDTRVVRAYLDRHVGNIELDRPQATRFEVDEDRTCRGPEEVARVRFSVQQLLGGRSALNCLTCALERVEEEISVALNQRRGFVAVRDKTLSLRASFREVRCLDRDAPHPRMQALQRVCVVRW